MKPSSLKPRNRLFGLPDKVLKHYPHPLDILFFNGVYSDEIWIDTDEGVDVWVLKGRRWKVRKPSQAPSNH